MSSVITVRKECESPMNSSAKLKSLQIERLESRDLMASYVASWQPSRFEATNDNNPAAISRGESGIGHIDRTESQEHSRGRQVGIGDLKDLPPNVLASNLDVPRFGAAVSVHLPQPARQIYLVFALRTSLSNAPISVGQSLAEPLDVDSHFFGETDSPPQRQDSVAEGEGNDADRPIHIRDAVPTHSVSVVRERMASSQKIPALLPGNFRTVEQLESTNSGDKFGIEDLFGFEHTVEQKHSSKKLLSEVSFSEIGSGRFRNGNDAAVDKILADLFSHPTTGEDDVASEQLSNAIGSAAESDVNWRYILSPMLHGNVSDSNRMPVASSSMFGIYDAGSVSSMGRGHSQGHQDVSLDTADERESLNSEPGEKISIMESRNMMIGLVLASVWFSVRSQRLRWNGRLGRWLKRSLSTRHRKESK